MKSQYHDISSMRCTKSISLPALVWMTESDCWWRDVRKAAGLFGIGSWDWEAIRPWLGVACLAIGVGAGGAIALRARARRRRRASGDLVDAALEGGFGLEDEDGFREPGDIGRGAARQYRLTWG